MCSDLYADFATVWGRKDIIHQVRKKFVEIVYLECFILALLKLISRELVKPDGTVRVVFATTALGMGVNFVGLRATIHYGAPRSLDDYSRKRSHWSCWRVFNIYHLLETSRCTIN